MAVYQASQKSKENYDSVVFYSEKIDGMAQKSGEGAAGCWQQRCCWSISATTARRRIWRRRWETCAKYAARWVT